MRVVSSRRSYTRPSNITGQPLARNPCASSENGLRMNAKSCKRPETRDGSASRSSNSTKGMFRGRGRKRASTNLSPVIRSVVADFVDSLRSTGEGALPLVLAIRPELSTQEIPENGREFVRRVRLLSAAERRFFKTIEPPLRVALVRVLTSAARDFRHANGATR